MRIFFFSADEAVRDDTCSSVRQKLLKESTPNVFGQYIPACSDDGNYARQQCHPSTGYCWCVDPVTGKEIAETSVPPGGNSIDCDPVTTPEPPQTPSKTLSLVFIAVA